MAEEGEMNLLEVQKKEPVYLLVLNESKSEIWLEKANISFVHKKGGFSVRKRGNTFKFKQIIAEDQFPRSGCNRAILFPIEQFKLAESYRNELQLLALEHKELIYEKHLELLGKFLFKRFIPEVPNADINPEKRQTARRRRRAT